MFTSLFSQLGRAVARRPLTTVVVWAVLAVVGYVVAFVGVGGSSLFDRVTTGAVTVPGSESQAGFELLSEIDTSGESVTLVVQGVDPASPVVVEAMATENQRLAAIPGVATVIDPYVLEGGLENPAASTLVARSGDGFVLEVTLDLGLADAERDEAHDLVVDRLRALPAALGDDATGLVSSTDLVIDEITGQVREDLETGELIALPIALLVMVLVFGGFLAASMPMAGAIASIGAGLGLLLAQTYLLEVDASVVNVITLLAIGLSIDYGLLVVSRYREELANLTDDEEAVPGLRRRRGDGVVQEAIARTLATAGQTVAFSAVTVAISIAGLLVFTPEILRSIGAGGVTVILVAVLTALTLVPALLTLTGRRLARPGLLGRIPGLRVLLARTADTRSDEGVFSRLAARVQKHPGWTALGSLLVLLVLALPVVGLQMRSSGIELLPRSSDQRVLVEVLADDYPASDGPEVFVVADTSLDAVTGLVGQMEELEHVTGVDEPREAGGYLVLGVNVEGGDPAGTAAVDVVQGVRGLDPGYEKWVTGQAAAQLDFRDALTDRVWWAVAIVAAATLVLLFLMTGSLVLPVKAMLTNAVSISASLGVLVWVFQEGHLEGLLGFDAVGGIETYVVAIVIAFAFGLAMDYELFLLSRVLELHREGRSDDEAVRIGLQRSGRIITSAAAIIVVVFAGFVFGRLLVIKEVGFALALAVLVDATLVRLLLVPATMTLLGRWNWWAPVFLRRIHARAAITH